MKDILNFLLPILLVATGMFATAAWVTLKSNIAASWKMGLVPLALAGAVAAPLSVGDMFGRALPTTELPDRMIVYAHKTIIMDGKKQRIEIYASEPRSPTRLRSVPYSKELEKALQQAAQGREQGLQAELSRRKPGDGTPQSKERTPGGEWRLDLKRPEDLMPPKDSGPPETPNERAPGTHPPAKPGTMV